MFFNSPLFYDPGLSRLKLAFKVTLAVCLSVIATYLWLPPLVLIVLTFAVATSVATGTHKNLWNRWFDITIAYLTVFMLTVMGTLLKPYPEWTLIILLILGFCMFFIRRFGAKYYLFPFLGTITYIISANVHLPLNTTIPNILLGYFIGWAIASIIVLYLWPPRPLHCFRALIKDNLQTCCRIINSLSNQLNNHKANFTHIHSLLNRLNITINQQIRTASLLTELAQKKIQEQDPNQKPLFESMSIKQYALGKILRSIWEAMNALDIHELDLTLKAQITQALTLSQTQLNQLKSTLTSPTTTTTKDQLSFRACIDQMIEHTFENIQQTHEPYLFNLSNLLFALSRLQELICDTQTLISKGTAS